MRLIVNGDPHEHHGDGTLPVLLKELGADGDRVAVLVNGTVVRKEDRPTRRLREQDQVEVLVFAGGG